MTLPKRQVLQALFGIIFSEVLGKEVLYGVVETYLDLDILINGGMDALLLVLTGRLLHLSIRPRRIFLGVLLGSIPVVLACYSISPWTTISKFLIPLLMVGVSYSTRKWIVFIKAFLGFWLLSAGLGGFVYAAWGWTQFDQGVGGEIFSMALNNLWILPLCALTWWLLEYFWQQWQKNRSMLDQILYDLEIDFGEGAHKKIRIKALLDTGNHLRDPLTGRPVILMEEEVAASALPDKVRSFLNIPWKESTDPWPLLWKIDPGLVQHLVFIPFHAVDHKSWLLGVRPKCVTCFDGKETRQIHATVAFVNQVLNLEGEYQALLHPDHVQKGGD